MKISIPINLSDLKEAKPVPNGRYGLTVASVEEGESQGGFPQLKASIAIDGHDDAPNLTHFISLPSPGDAKSQAKAIFLARFLNAFNIPVEDDGLAFDTDDFPGATADNLELSLSKPDDNGNVYNRIMLPKLPDEEGARTAPRPPQAVKA